MKKILTPIGLCLLLATSCKKEEPNNNVTIPTYKTYSSMDEIFNELSLKPKVISVDATAGSSFYGNSGTRYILPPNCFLDASGAIVTGNVQVEVTEWLRKGDMIFSGMLPVSDGQALISGGEINITATQGGKKIFLRPGYSFQANIPLSGSKDTDMSVFRGNATGDITSKVNWAITKQDSIRLDTSTYATTRYIKTMQDSLKIVCDSLEFWNCDHFMSYPNLQSFNMIVAATGATVTSATNLQTYCMFDGMNGVMQQFGSLKENGYSYALNNIPSMPVHFVSFGLINGHFYGGALAAISKTGETYTVTLTEVDPKDFKAQLALYP